MKSFIEKVPKRVISFYLYKKGNSMILSKMWLNNRDSLSDSPFARYAHTSPEGATSEA